MSERLRRILGTCGIAGEDVNIYQRTWVTVKYFCHIWGTAPAPSSTGQGIAHFSRPFH